MKEGKICLFEYDINVKEEVEAEENADNVRKCRKNLITVLVISVYIYYNPHMGWWTHKYCKKRIKHFYKERNVRRICSFNALNKNSIDI